MNKSESAIEIKAPAAPSPSDDHAGLGTRYMRGEIDRNSAILELAASFPTLKWQLMGMNSKNWDINRFMSNLGVLCSGERHAKLFVASVWDSEWPADHGMEFRVVDAISVWDVAHRASFLQWCHDPFWP